MSDYPRLSVVKAQVVHDKLAAYVQFDADLDLSEVKVGFGVDYLLVPAEDQERAFASLQDAGEAAGVPVGEDILGTIRGMRGLLGEAMSLLQEMAEGMPASDHWQRVKRRATNMVESYDLDRQRVQA